jgi:hypothetical protein
LAPVITNTPPWNSFARMVLPESRAASRSDAVRMRRRLSSISAIDTLLGIALGHLDGRPHRHHRAGRVVDHVANPVRVPVSVAADLRCLS